MTDSLHVTVRPHPTQTPAATDNTLALPTALGLTVAFDLGNHLDPAAWLHALVDAANELAWQLGCNAHDCPGVTGGDCATCEAAIAGGAA